MPGRAESEAAPNRYSVEEEHPLPRYQEEEHREGRQRQHRIREFHIARKNERSGLVPPHTVNRKQPLVYPILSS